MRTSSILLLVGGPASTGLLLWMTLPSAADGANIGLGALWLLAVLVLVLGLVLGLVGAVLRASENRSQAVRIAESSPPS
ncbi:hypothetical protein [Pseudokineococcus sp. 1T1Z-3]|uniref:hypothetical protein n=1 Tax=Pseudokineococcus sp. 1T1Z-3 TaxID=3132745 RepID=UPI0030A4DB0B